MPTLTRLIFVLLFLCAAVYAAMLGLATWVRPVMTPMTVDIPASRVQPRPRSSAEKARIPEQAGARHTISGREQAAP